MKFGDELPDLDEIDLGILSQLQENCRTSLAKIGEHVGLTAPSVVERVKKLEDSGVITGYHARLDARRLGQDITAFIGVEISHPKLIRRFEDDVARFDDVLECHHVTGVHTLLLKVKTRNTSSLEELIRKLRSIEGVDRTETMVVLSTHTERSEIALEAAGSAHEHDGGGRKPRRNGAAVARSHA